MKTDRAVIELQDSNFIDAVEQIRRDGYEIRSLEELGDAEGRE